MMSLFFYIDLRFCRSLRCTSIDPGTLLGFNPNHCEPSCIGTLRTAICLSCSLELCPHRTNWTFMSAKFFFIVLCLVLFVKIPLFPRDPVRIRATVEVLISILFQDKTLLLKCKNYKVYAVVLFAIFSYLTCSNQSLFVHPPSCIFDFILSTIFIYLFYVILPFLSFSPLYPNIQPPYFFLPTQHNNGSLVTHSPQPPL